MDQAVITVPSGSVTVEEIRDRLAAVRARIDAAGGSSTRLVAVTKGFGAEVVAAAVEAGAVDLGESYAQELVAKAAVLDDQGVGVGAWHFIGRLQRNKVRVLAPLVSLWQSIDRPAIAAEVAARAPGAAVLVQINLSGEPQKGGCDLADAERLVDDARERGLDVRGLMGVGPAGPPEAARAPFRSLVRLADRLELPERSIGMSADLEVAIEEGSTMVRVGTDLFGARPARGIRP